MTAELMGPTAKPYAEDWLARILLPDRTTYKDWYFQFSDLACLTVPDAPGFVAMCIRRTLVIVKDNTM